ncbi:uncharacterized protein LOC134281993 [Saccostrea cucullata]|uniref:uncharacterized protein LOC134281993 n=1 Tax=Saccostrea cuccullata TaxID=36930 RepID=UPI002ED36BC3
MVLVRRNVCEKPKCMGTPNIFTPRQAFFLLLDDLVFVTWSATSFYSYRSSYKFPECDESMDHTVANSESTAPYLGCALHRQKRCAMYCKDCDLLICHTCLKTICPTYQDIAADAQNVISKIEKEYEDLSTDIAIQEDNLHKEIDKLFNKSKAKTDEMKHKQLHTLQNHLDDISRKLMEIDDEIDSIDKTLGSNDISTILQVLHTSKVEQHKRLPNKLVPSGPKFTPGKIQDEKLSKFVGTLSTFNLTTEKHGYSLKVTHEPLEFEKLSPITSKLTEIYSRDAVSLESPEAGSSP